jgi:hypothetical protein
VQSRQGTAVLDALELLDGDRLTPKESRYGKHFLELPAKKSQEQVLNRGELIGEVQGVEYDSRFRLEPEWVVVVLAALVYSGDITLTLPGKKLDAASLDEFPRTSLNELTNFKHIERPKDLPIAALSELVDLFGIARGLLLNPATRDEAVKQLQTEVSRLLDHVVRAQQQVQDGVPFWGGAILSAPEQADAKIRFDSLKSFLESLQAFNTPGKLKNFKYDVSQVGVQKETLAHLKSLEELAQFARDVGTVAAYIVTAEAVMPADVPWRDEVQARRGEILAQLSSPKKRGNVQTQRQVGQILSQLEQKYAEAYLALHARARLGANQDSKKKKLLQDERLARLMKLVSIELLPRAQLTELQNTLAGLKPCFSLTKSELDAAAVCPHCQYLPVAEPLPESVSAPQTLDAVDNDLDRIHDEWTRTLIENLSDPTVKRSMEALASKQRTTIDSFLIRKSFRLKSTMSSYPSCSKYFKGSKSSRSTHLKSRRLLPMEAPRAPLQR